MKLHQFFFFLFSALSLFAYVPSSFAKHEVQQQPQTAPVLKQQSTEVISGALAQEAVALLQVELGNLTSLMELIATNPNNDAIFISNLRQGLRRSFAALTIYADLLPQRDFQWVKQQLTQLRIATDPVSDDDALYKILVQEFPCCSGKYPFGDFQEERQKDQQPLLSVINDLQQDDLFKTRVEHMLQRVAWPIKDGVEPASSELAKQKLSICLEETFQPLPTEETSFVELHQFRIRIKKLRYMVELPENVFSLENYATIDPQLVSLQSTLGRIHDLFNLQQKVQDKLNNPMDLDVALLSQILARDEELLQEAHQDFFVSCTPAFFQKLQDDIKASINL